MKLGLYTECFGNRSFEEMLSLSQSMGIKYLEIGTGNWSKPAHMDLNLLLSSSDARDEYLGKINEKGLYLEALNCSGNQLEPSDTGREHEAVVYKTFQLAELLGVKKIVMMSGLPGGGPDSPYPVWVTNTWPHNFTDMLNYQWDSIAIPWWKEAAKKASSHGIEQIAIENHPNNLVYNVSTIRRLHEEAGEIIGLNLDPSHSFYMGGDPIIMAKKLATDGLIYHVHGKDTRIEKDIADTEMLFETCDHMAPQNIRPWNYVAVGY